METKYLKIGLIFAFCIIIVFLLVKIFLPKKTTQPQPSQPSKVFTPEEVAIKFFELESEGNRIEAEKFLFSDFLKVKIFDEEYLILKSNLWSQPNRIFKANYNIKSKEIKEKESKISLEIEVKEGVPFLFVFNLPEKVNFEIELTKENNEWKIVKIDSPDLIVKTKIGERVEIKKNIFINTNRIGEFISKEIEPSEINDKILFLETEYENSSEKEIFFSPLAEWRISNTEGEFFYGIKFTNGTSTQIKIGGNESKRIKIFFEVPQNFSVKEVIFQNLDKKVIFEI
jgi:hypothetical protein